MSGRSIEEAVAKMIISRREGGETESKGKTNESARIRLIAMITAPVSNIILVS